MRSATDEMVSVARDGASRTLAILGVDDDESITSQTFEKAVAYAKARAAELVGKSWNDDGELIDNPDADMSITDTLRDELRDAVQQAIEDGDSAAELSDRIEALAGFGEERATMIARTECLLGDTPVDAAVVRAAFRRPYVGDVVEVITAGGRKFTATPNHPMLTRCGWVAAGDLSDLDDLFCDGGQENLGAHGDHHEHARPPTIAQIFSALLDAGPAERYAGSRLEFHGDGMDGDVNVVRPDRELMVGAFAEIRQPSANVLFTQSDHKTMPAFCPSCGRLLTIDKQSCFCCRPQRHPGAPKTHRDAASVDPEPRAESNEGSARDVGAHKFVNRNIVSSGGGDPASRVSDSRSLLMAAHLNTGASKHKYDPVRTHAERLGDLGSAHARAIHRGDAFSVEGRSSLEQRSARPTSPLDTAGLHVSPQPLRRDPEASGDQMPRDTGRIEFDRVVSVVRLQFAGHVYNLETPFGYFCIAGGAYTGNTIRANAKGQMQAMRSSGVVEQKAWSTAGEDVCDECQANEDLGAIALEDDFDGGDEPVDAPPMHPGCRCVVTAVIDDSASDDAEDDRSNADEEEDDSE